MHSNAVLVRVSVASCITYPRLLNALGCRSEVRLTLSFAQLLSDGRNLEFLLPQIVLVDGSAVKRWGLTKIEANCTKWRARMILLISEEDRELFLPDALTCSSAAGFLGVPCPEEMVFDAIQVAARGALYLSGSLRSDVMPASGTRRINAVSSLTSREWEVLDLQRAGCSYKQIADRLQVHPSTVNNHLAHIREKLGAHSATEAIGKAYF